MRKFSFLVFIFFAAAETGAGLGFAQTAQLQGRIVGLRPIEDGRYEIQIQHGEEISTFFLNRETMIEAPVPVKEIRKGQKIRLPGGAGRGDGGAILKDPLESLSDGTKKALNLPDVPNVPGVPDLEKIPDPNQIKESVAAAKAAAGKAEAQAGPGGVPGGMMPPAPGGGGRPRPEPKEEKIPEDDMFGPPQPTLSRPSGAAAPVPSGMPAGPLQVVGSEETAQGIRIQLEGPQGGQEEVTLPPDVTVLQVLDPSQLQEDMQVSLMVEEAADGKWIRRLTIA